MSNDMCYSPICIYNTTTEESSKIRCIKEEKDRPVCFITKQQINETIFIHGKFGGNA